MSARGCMMVIGLAVAIFILLVAGAIYSWTRMPGASHTGDLPPLTAEENALSNRLRRHVHILAAEIGERNLQCHARLEQAAGYINEQFREAGFEPAEQRFTFEGSSCANIEVVIEGTSGPRPCLVIGAHYDTVEDCPGANDNGSGIAALIEMARMLSGRPLPHTFRFVAFANEEPPYFITQKGMGSIEYVRRLNDTGVPVSGMISLETIGYYRDQKGSQAYPPPIGFLYPDTGNFIGFVGNTASRRFVRRVIGLFREHTAFPSEGIAAPAAIPGISWSDHRSFWSAGIPALMVTDTAPFRYPHYHRVTDTPEHLDYDRMARVVLGLVKAVEELTASGQNHSARRSP